MQNGSVTLAMTGSMCFFAFHLGNVHLFCFGLYSGRLNLMLIMHVMIDLTLLCANHPKPPATCLRRRERLCTQRRLPHHREPALMRWVGPRQTAQPCCIHTFIL